MLSVSCRVSEKENSPAASVTVLPVSTGPNRRTFQYVTSAPAMAVPSMSSTTRPVTSLVPRSPVGRGVGPGVGVMAPAAGESRTDTTSDNPISLCLDMWPPLDG